MVEFIRESALDEKLKDKVQIFKRTFRQRTKLNSGPQFIVSAPGRINLIGDHVDYHGFPVLPMAIERHIWLACGAIPLKNTVVEAGETRRGELGLSNVNQEEYPDWRGEHTFGHGGKLDESHQWQNYFLCGYHGLLTEKLLNIEPDRILQHAKLIRADKALRRELDHLLEDLPSFEVLVDSDLPPAAGLSSSSALVCAAAVATSVLYSRSQLEELQEDGLQSRSDDQRSSSLPSTSFNEPQQQQANVEQTSNATMTDPPKPLDNQWPLIDPHHLATCCAKFEHLIGTRGGGMDQAIIMTAQRGFATFVEFEPNLKCECVGLPKDVVWLISHCGVSCPKAATSGFNTRVLETKLAAALIAQYKAASGNCQTVAIDSTITLSQVKEKYFKGMTNQQIVYNVRESVFSNKDEYTVSEICSRLKLTRAELCERFNISDDFLTEALNDKLKLVSRCEHVLEEAERVERFKSICDSNPDIRLLGRLMTESHQSLRDKYDCSHPALDRLVDTALNAGALGARLTGAGWAGCIVTLVEESNSQAVFEELCEVSDMTIRTEPQGGCYVIELDDE